MLAISTPAAPTPAGHYSQALVHDGLVYVAGQLPTDPAVPGSVPEGPEAQARQTLLNVRSILEAAGSGLDRVLQLTIYLTDMTHWAAVDGACAEAFGEHRPTRAIVPIGTLKPGMILEVQAVAALR